MGNCSFSVLAYFQVQDFLTNMYDANLKHEENFQKLLETISGSSASFNTIDLKDKTNRDILSSILRNVIDTPITNAFITYVLEEGYNTKPQDPERKKEIPNSPQQGTGTDTDTGSNSYAEIIRTTLNLDSEAVNKINIAQDYFAGDTFVFQKFELAFRNNIFQRSIVNFDTGQSVRTNTDLSKNLHEYYKNMKGELENYLVNKGVAFTNDTMLSAATSHFKELLSKSSPAKLVQEDPETFKMYSNFVTLKVGYDNLVNLYNLNIIQIKNNKAGKYEGDNDDKYMLNVNAKFAFAYGNDNFSILDETTNLIKTLVDVTPVVKRKRRGEAYIADGEYLQMNSLMGTVTKLKKVIALGTASKNLGTRMNPFVKMKGLIELILGDSSTTRSSIFETFTVKDKDNLRSIYNFYYKSGDVSEELKADVLSDKFSLAEIYMNDIRKGTEIDNENDMYVNITSHFDKAVNKLYVAGIYNKDTNEYELKNLKSLTIDKKYSMIKNNINGTINNNLVFARKNAHLYDRTNRVVKIGETSVSLNSKTSFMNILISDVTMYEAGNLKNPDKLKAMKAIVAADNILKLNLMDDNAKLLKLILEKDASTLSGLIDLAAQAVYFSNVNFNAINDTNLKRKNNTIAAEDTFKNISDTIGKTLNDDKIFSTEDYFKNGRTINIFNDNSASKSITPFLLALSSNKSIIDGDEEKSITKAPSGAGYASVGLIAPVHDDNTNFGEIQKVIQDIYESTLGEGSISFEDALSGVPVAQNLFSQYDPEQGLVNYKNIIQETLRTDIQDAEGETKNASKMSSAEIFTEALLLDFFGGLTTEEESKNVGLQLVTYSDKIGQMLKTFNLKSDFNYKGNTYNFTKNINSNKLQTLHFNSIGNQYNALRGKIENDYKMMFDDVDPNFANDIIDRFTKNHKWLSNPDTFISPGVLSPKYKSERSEKVVAKLKKLTEQLTKLQSGNFTYFDMSEILPLMTEDEVVKRGVERGIEVIHEVHYSGRRAPMLNNLLEIEFKNYDNSKGGINPRQDKRMKTEQKKFLKDLLKEGVVIDCFVEDGSKIKDSLLKIESFINSSDFDKTFKIKDWVDTETGEMILFKTDNRMGVLEDFDFKNNYDPLRMDFSYQINPILDYFFWTHNILTSNYNLAVAGGIHGHELKGIQRNDVKGMSKEYNDSLFEEAIVSARTTASDKRNVFYQGTIHPYLQDLINGMPKDVKTATINDLSFKVFNALNQDEKFKIMDGAALMTAKAMILGDNSLGTLGTKSFTHKLIHHKYDVQGLIAELEKYAVFGITNELIRKSGDGKARINLKTILQKMEDLKINNSIFDPEYNKIDPLKGISKDNSNIVYDEDGFGMFRYLQNKVFYKKPENDYITEVLGFKPVVDTNGNTLYQVKTRIYSKSGVSPTPIINNDLVRMDSVYSIWEALGGEYSVETNPEGMFKTAGESYTYSEKSNYNVVEIMSNFKKLLPGKSELMSASSYSMPFKDGMIYQLNNTSGIKNGAKNINNSNKWTNTEPLYHYMTNTLHWGIQGNFDHGYDEHHAAQVTEMSQVISAAEANGYLHAYATKLYKNIANVVKMSMKKYDPELAKTLEGNNELYLALTKDMMDSLLNKDELGFAQVQLTRVQKSLEKIKNENGDIDTDKIDKTILTSFSDNNMYSAMISMISGAINRSSIKRKYSGIAAIIKPGHDIYTVHEDADGVIRGSEEIADAITSISFTPVTNNQITTQDRVKFTGKDADGKIIDKTINFDDLATYYAFKQNPEGYLNSLGMTTVIKREKLAGYARNLQNTRVRINLENGDVLDRYDLDSVKAVNGLDNLIDQIGKAPKLENNPSEYEKEEYVNKRNKFFKELNDLLTSDNVASLSLFYPGIVQEIQNSITNDVIPSKIDDSEIRRRMVKEIQDDHVLLENGQMRLPIKYGSSGEIVNVTVNKKAAECILSNINRFKYGIEKGVKLSSINLDYFKEKLTNQALTDFDHSDFYLSNMKGNELHLINDERLKKINNPNLKKLNMETITETDEDGNEVKYIIDPNTGSKLYEAHEGILGLYSYKGKIMVAYDHKLANDAITHLVENPNLAYTNFNYNTNKVKNSSMQDLTLKLQREYAESTEPTNYKLHKILNSPISGMDAAYRDYKIKDIDRRAMQLNESWKKQLQMIAARIPAQSLQSFMTMDVVGFVEDDINAVVLPAAKNWLDGSDFDIDKTYMLSFGVDGKGLLYHFNDFFEYQFAEEAYLEMPIPSGEAYAINNIDYTTPEHDKTITDALAYVVAKKAGFEFTKEEYTSFLKLASDVIENKVLELPTELANMYPLEELHEAINLYHTGRTAKQLAEGKEPKIISPDVILETSKNMVAQTLITISGSITNLMSSERPVDMDDPRAAAKKTTKAQDARELSRENPMTIFKQIIQQNAGKAVVGISAVAEKIFFDYSFITNEKIQELELMQDLSIDQLVEELDNISGKSLIPVYDPQTKKVVKYIRPNMIANANMEKTPRIKEAYQLFLERLNNTLNDGSHDAPVEVLNVTDMNDMSLVISAVLSAATDNAKELILDKINAGPELAGVYMYMIMQGVKFDDIADIMISDVVNKVVAKAKQNWFTSENSGNSIDTAIKYFAEGVNPKNYLSNKAVKDLAGAFVEKTKIPKQKDVNNLDYIRTTIDGLSIDELIDLKKNLGLETSATQSFTQEDYEMANETGMELRSPSVFIRFKVNKYLNECIKRKKLIGNDPEGFKNELDSFIKLKKESEELTIFGRRLGINQGIKTTMYDSYSFDYSLDSFLFDQTVFARVLNPEKDSELIEDAIKLGIPHQKLSGGTVYITYLPIKAVYSMNDEVQDFYSKLYNRSKYFINIFEAELKSPHFKSMIKAGYDSQNAFRTRSIRYRMHEDLVAGLSQNRIKLNQSGYPSKLKDKDFNSISNYVLNTLINDFFINERMSFKIPADFYYFNNRNEMTFVDSEQSIDLSTSEGKASFKAYFEQYLVPSLTEMEGSQDNEFIKNLGYDSKSNSITGSKFPYVKMNFDTSSITEMNKKNPNQNADIIFSSIKDGFENLKGVTLNGNNVWEMFGIYNILINKNAFGSNTFTKLFQSTTFKTDENSIIYRFMDYVGKKDKHQDLQITDQMLIEASMRIAEKTDSNEPYGDTNEYIKVFDKDLGKHKIYKKIKGTEKNSYEEVKLVNDPGDLSSYLLDDFLDSSKFNTFVASRNNNAELLYNTTLDSSKFMGLIKC